MAGSVRFEAGVLFVVLDACWLKPLLSSLNAKAPNNLYNEQGDSP